MAGLDFVIISRKEARSKGLKQYFTGKPCKYGHIERRLISSFICMECARIKVTVARQKNPELVREWQRRSNVKNPNTLRLAKARWTKKNPARTKAHAATNYARHRARRLLKMREYQERHADRLKAYYKEYHAKNPDRARIASRNRKARKRQAVGTHTAKDVAEIFVGQRGCCAYCRHALKKPYHVDHIVALANGGSNDRRNLQLLCKKCNLQKGTRDPIDHVRLLGMLI